MKVTVTNNFFAGVTPDAMNTWSESDATFTIGPGEVVLDRLLVMPLAAAVDLGIVRWNEETRQHELVASDEGHH